MGDEELLEGAQVASSSDFLATSFMLVTTPGWGLGRASENVHQWKTSKVVLPRITATAYERVPNRTVFMSYFVGHIISHQGHMGGGGTKLKTKTRLCSWRIPAADK